MDTIDLSGEWRLYGRPQTGDGDKTPFVTGEISCPATVPGNLEADLFAAGLAPDPYWGRNAQLYRRYEFFQWCYYREFDCAAEAGESWVLCLEGVDCLASVYVNNEQAGVCENALIPHRFEVTGFLRPGRNRLAVVISSANYALAAFPLLPGAFSIFTGNYESLRLRKPAHVWGWDIAPRLALGGLFRGVCLECLRPVRFIDHALVTGNRQGNRWTMLFHYQVAYDYLRDGDLEVILEGRCGDSRFAAREIVWSAQGTLKLQVVSPKLWFPRNYGEPDLYEISAVIAGLDGTVHDRLTFAYGIREIKLICRETATESLTPDFGFVVNDVPVRVFGCNHVPADALHSRDLERLPQILEMFVDLNCNMVRIWGGNLYENNLFYDFCDRHGIMIWHDFMMGCSIYPDDEAMRQALSAEMIAVLKRLRHHASIALWVGDNEGDLVPYWGQYIDPNQNKLTRQWLPELCRMYDPGRAYLPSSPYLSTETVARAMAISPEYDPMLLAPEQHLWGPRDYFKSDFYRQTKASFVSEIGYHGCPDTESIRKFIPAGSLWPWDNDDWYYHASNPFLPDLQTNYRISIMDQQIREFFGEIPDNLEDFALASQICQAEANKFFVELVKLRRKMSGILWWNLIDCWPQFSDAVVDYYGNKKLAYHYLRQLQQPVTVIGGEAFGWGLDIWAVNDSSDNCSGTVSVVDFESGKMLYDGDFAVAANANLRLTRIKCFSTQQGLWLIRWRLSDGQTGCNHVLCGYPRYDYDWIKRVYLPAVGGLDGSFGRDIEEKS